MKSLFFNCLCLVLFTVAVAQENKEINSTVIDSLYREDQFYLGISYHLLLNTPNNFSQNGFSNTIYLGSIRDFPISKNRRFAIAAGLGYSFTTINHNLLANRNTQNELEYLVLANTAINFTKNRYYFHTLEVPVELRWRSSTPTNHKFWRVYPGFKTSYNIATITKFEGDLGKKRYTDKGALNPLQYGLTLSVGYGSVNFHLYYGLNAIFKDNTFTTSGDKLALSSCKMGIVFYLL